MALKTANFNMRMDENKKREAEELFEKLGMTLPQAVNMFISQSLLVGGLPFEVRVPRYNAATEAAIKEANDISLGKKVVKTYSSAEKMFEDLNQ